MKVSCSCGAKYNVPENFAGRKVKCKKCKESFIAGGGSGQPVTRPVKRKKKQLSKSEREDALLKKHSSGSNLEERMAQRERDTIEADRTSNGLTLIAIGAMFLLGSILAWFGLSYLAENGGRVPRIVALLVLLRGEWWVPGLMVLMGLYKIFIGILVLMKRVDVVEDQLPQM